MKCVRCGKEEAMIAYHGFCSIECLNDYKLRQNYGATGMRPLPKDNTTVDDIIYNSKMNAVVRLNSCVNIAIICDKEIDVEVFKKAATEFRDTLEINL